jgi:catechol 2,3-dioxygenase-like lactoylglutathione lyase family enzyme
MAVWLHHVVIDAHDLPALARFWAQVLGWRILSEHEQEIVIGADATAPVGICFMPVSDAKTTKNRLHLDLSPDPGEQEAEIQRILALGARRVDIGQTGAESWTVLADPRATSSAWSVPSGPSSTRTPLTAPPLAAACQRRSGSPRTNLTLRQRGANGERLYEGRPRRPCHQRAIHSRPDRSRTDNHG